MSEQVASHALINLANRYIEQYKVSNSCLPLIEHDEDWQSDCEVGQCDAEGYVKWQPVPRDEFVDINNIEAALDVKLHPSVNEFYGCLYSSGIPALFEGNWLELLQPWNENDFNRLQENIIAHALMKKKLKQQFTIFIAVTDDDEYLISILNKTGEVVLEPVGKEPIKVLAPSLAEFINQLEPAIAVD